MPPYRILACRTRCEGSSVISDDHVVQVGDGAWEQSDDDQTHRDTASEECAATACEPDDRSAPGHRNVDDQPRQDREKEEEEGYEQEDREYERKDGPGASGPAGRLGREAVAVAVGDRHNGHAVEDRCQAESGHGQPPRSDKVEVGVVGPQRIDTGGGDHEVQNTEDNAPETTARKPAPTHDIYGAAQQARKDAAKNEQGDRAAGVDAADYFVCFGQSALRVIAGGHSQQPHDQPDGRARHKSPGPEPADERDGNTPQITKQAGVN